MYITHTVVAKVAKSSMVWMSYSMTKLQYSLTAKNIAVNSWDLSDNPVTSFITIIKTKTHKKIITSINTCLSWSKNNTLSQPQTQIKLAHVISPDPCKFLRAMQSKGIKIWKNKSQKIDLFHDPCNVLCFFAWKFKLIIKKINFWLIKHKKGKILTYPINKDPRKQKDSNINNNPKKFNSFFVKSKGETITNQHKSSPSWVYR